MKEMSSFQENVSADKTSIGFEYQFYYFMYKILGLKKGNRLGYEVKDDVHLELSNGEYILMQLKHSMKQKSDGSISNLTTKDIDFWKTIYNWINMINEIDEGKYSKEKLIKYTFILVTNKGQSKENIVISNIEDFRKDKISIEEIKNNIKQLMDNTNSKEKLFKYMKTFYDLSNDILEVFLKRIKFDLEFDDIIQKIKDKIESEAYIDKKRIDDVLNELIGNFAVWKFETVKGNGLIIIDYEEAYKRIRPCYEKIRTQGIPNRKIHINLPDKIMNQKFIEELIEIGDIDEDDINEAIKFTRYMLNINGLLEVMYQEGLTTKLEIQHLEKEAISLWENIHRQSYRKTKRKIKNNNLNEDKKIEELYDKACDCIAEIRKQRLKVNKEELDIQLCNGEYYSLANEERVGWKLNWEDKYK
ncbi:hypothetical protein FDA39_06300 [Clostridium botulinum]|nr:hypothetical protein [Clostridium botulinum]